MRHINVDLIRVFNPCYNPTTKVPPDWSGTVLDVIDLKNVDVDLSSAWESPFAEHREILWNKARLKQLNKLHQMILAMPEELK